MNTFSNWFAFVRVAGNQGYVSSKVILLKNICTDCYWHGLSSHLLTTMHEIDPAAEGSLELFQENILEFFCINT